MSMIHSYIYVYISARPSRGSAGRARSTILRWGAGRWAGPGCLDRGIDQYSNDVDNNKSTHNNNDNNSNHNNNNNNNDIVNNNST